jgi:hypothetical protein
MIYAVTIEGMSSETALQWAENQMKKVMNP